MPPWAVRSPPAASPPRGEPRPPPGGNPDLGAFELEQAPGTVAGTASGRSLLGSGLWSLGHTVALTKHLGQRMEAFPPGVHGSPINPLVGLYATADDRYISFVMMQPTKFWADV